MSDTQLLRYSSLIVFRPSAEWKLEVLSFIVDQKIEFLQQWLSYKDDPLQSILSKMYRITGKYPLIIGIDPVYTYVNENEIQYFACTVSPFIRLPSSVQYYDQIEWRDPRSVYRLLAKDTYREALIRAIRWIYSDNGTPLFMTRNQIIR